MSYALNGKTNCKTGTEGHLLQINAGVESMPDNFERFVGTWVMRWGKGADAFGDEITIGMHNGQLQVDTAWSSNVSVLAFECGNLIYRRTLITSGAEWEDTLVPTSAGLDGDTIRLRDGLRFIGTATTKVK